MSSLMVDCSKGDKTQQRFRKQCDINLIVAKAERAGGLDMTARGRMFFGDFHENIDLKKAHDTVRKAQTAFMSLPWRVRERFGYEPQKLVEFLKDNRNDEEAISLGLKMPRARNVPAGTKRGNLAAMPTDKPADKGGAVPSSS